MWHQSYHILDGMPLFIMMCGGFQTLNFRQVKANTDMSQKLFRKQFRSTSMFIPAGWRVSNWKIHFVSFCEILILLFSPLLCPLILFMAQKTIQVGSFPWQSLKCLETLCLLNPFFMLVTCSRILTHNCLVVLPTYCLWHGHSIKQVTWVVLQVINSLMLYSFPLATKLNFYIFSFVFLLTLHGRHFPLLKNPLRFLNNFICFGGSRALCTNLFLKDGAQDFVRLQNWPMFFYIGLHGFVLSAISHQKSHIDVPIPLFYVIYRLSFNQPVSVHCLHFFFQCYQFFSVISFFHKSVNYCVCLFLIVS